MPEKFPPEATVGVWRVATREDSAILKVVALQPSADSQWPAAAGPGHPYYWKREPLVYGSSLLDRLAGGLRAPACRALVDRADGSVAIWLEDVPAAPPWTVERLGALAYGAGVTQAGFAADLPDDDWLGRGWLREYVRLHDMLDAEAERVLARLDALPWTLCHLDLHPGNVLGETAGVVVDWAHSGLAALGLDPGVMVADGVMDEVFPAELADAATETVWAGYLAGLRDGGWVGEEHDVRWAFLRGTALRLSWLPRSKPSWAATRALLDRWTEAARHLG